HASLLSGRYPTAHGVHDNGTFKLGDVPTLATALQSAGYRTGAFVGAFVLDARFGLDRGFDLYDDRVAGSSADLEVVQRTAEEVLAPALEWIAARGSTLRQAQGSPRASPDNARPEPFDSTLTLSLSKGERLAQDRPVEGRAQPWFAWVHLYDPHEPYAPPEPYRSRYAGDPYAGEIAYADASLGAFFDRLRAAGSLSNALVVVAADHGESLGEHGERTHGLFAYDATLRVPWILWAPPAVHPGVVRLPARLIDLMPTVLDLVGVGVPPRLDGRSLRPFLAGQRAGDDP